jgi:hypothetical protein
MDKRRGHAARPHATEAEIRAALLDLLARPYDETLLPEFDTHLPEDRRASCAYPETLRIRSVRMHILNYWWGLHQFGKPTSTQIQKVAESQARWIVKKHLPGDREILSDLASDLMAQLCRLLALPDLTDELPAIVFPEPGKPSAKDRCPYSPLLRMDSVRPLILAASQQMTPRQRATLKDRRHIASPILRIVMDHYPEWVRDQDVARFTTRSGERHRGQQSRHRYACEVFSAKRIPVIALKNCRVPSGNYLRGATFEVDALEFLDQAHHFARSLGFLAQPHDLTGRAVHTLQSESPLIDPRHVPVYVATRQHAATKARTCWAILEVLGARRHRSAGQPVHMSHGELVQAITGSKGGKRYTEIRDMTDALYRLGLVRIETRDGDSTNSRKVALDLKKVKYLRKPFRR